MRTTLPLAALLLLSLGAGAAGAERARSKKVATADASSCPRLSQEVDEAQRGIVFRLRNSCAVPIRCEISWEVRCNRGDRQRHDDGAQIDGQGEASFSALSGCPFEESWSVSPATYTCRAAASGASATR